MAHEPLLAFLEKASQDLALQEQLNGAMDAEAVAAVAHAAGCTGVTANQVSSFLAEVASQQAASGDQELEGVTGGLSTGAAVGISAAALLAVGALTVKATLDGTRYNSNSWAPEARQDRKLDEKGLAVVFNGEIITDPAVIVRLPGGPAGG